MGKQGYEKKKTVEMQKRIVPGRGSKKVLPGKKNADSALGFPVVGIGASAGGLAAFEAFFSGMPAKSDPGMAFVLVQHLAPNHKSILTDLVKRYTRMQVSEVEDGMPVRINCAYIIPPNHDMAFLNGSLQLLEPSATRGLRLPIDFFFRSLAQDQHERAIGIVLSGTGSDGTLGVRAIKDEGGMVMAQNPESTEYDGMPRSAIASGVVDYVLPPAEMAAQLVAYTGRAFGKASHTAPSLISQAESSLKKIFILLRSRTGHDFSQYKPNSISRCIERRMAVHQIERLDSYMHYLQQNPDEVDSLFRDLLIGVTSFFRDPLAYATLEAQVCANIFSGRPPGSLIRVWVIGCSSGEEAYSIAILLQERMEALKQNFKVQVFATDIDGKAIDQARNGIYPASIASDVSPERLRHFFIQEADGSHYRIEKNIRDMMIFSRQDVIKDPPFSKLDLISCRNLLIYMNGDLQKKLIPLFHYALNPGSLLFLGTSESVGEFVDLFATLDRKSKLYQRKEDIPGALRPFSGNFIPPQAEAGTAQRPARRKPGESKVQLREFTERALLQEYAPVGALVNERGDILYLHGRTGLYLEPAPGEAGMNILTMAREGLRADLTQALRKAVTKKVPVRCPGLKVKTNGDFTIVNLVLRPLAPGPDLDDTAAAPGLFLVILEPAPQADQGKAFAVNSGEHALDADARIMALKQELCAKDEYLQTANEELETANEELKSSNEEMQSVNEELQSTNEELETAKEELQSVNEELSTVNTELQVKVNELSRTNNDLNNLMASTGIGTIFVDRQLRILRFTPEVVQVINLILSDMGRPLGHIVSNLVNYDRLVADMQSVLDTLVPHDVEVQTRSGAWYLMRMRPYRTIENVIEGVVLTFTETSELKKANEALRKANELGRLAVVVRDAHDAISVQNLIGRILAWNPGAERMYGWSQTEALAMNVRDLIPEDKRKGALAVIRRLGRAEILEPYRTQRIARDGRIMEIWLTASALVNEEGEMYAIATTEREISIEPLDKKT